ncbi:hypothetical protein ACP70R_042374 [Stipagrostis hirtigluma subsp. patula]
MSRLSLVCLVFLSIAFLPPKSEGCQDCLTSQERNDEMFQVENLLHVSSSSKRTVISSSENTTMSGDRHHMVPKHKTSSISAAIGQDEDDDSDDVVYFAAHSSFPGKPYDGYFGLVVIVDVYGYTLSRGQMSTFTIWVANMGGGSTEKYNSIHVGWMVSPELYGDSNTHFYTYWTRWT